MGIATGAFVSLFSPGVAQLGEVSPETKIDAVFVSRRVVTNLDVFSSLSSDSRHRTTDGNVDDLSRSSSVDWTPHIWSVSPFQLSFSRL